MFVKMRVESADVSITLLYSHNNVNHDRQKKSDKSLEKQDG